MLIPFTVERRRREAINDGINEISRLVPNCDKNKGAILQRAIDYIIQINNDKKNLTERWVQTNMTTTQAIADVSATNIKLKSELNRRSDIALKWLQRCRDAGLEFDDYSDTDTLKPVEIQTGQTQTQNEGQSQSQD